MLAVGRFGRVSVRLAQEGATVAINFVGPPATAEETLGLVRAASADRAHREREHFIVRADIGSQTEIARMFETVLARWPHLDRLVNNAGFQRESPSEVLDVETYRRILDVNLTGAVLCAQKALAHFVSRGAGLAKFSSYRGSNSSKASWRRARSKALLRLSKRACSSHP